MQAPKPSIAPNRTGNASIPTAQSRHGLRAAAAAVATIAVAFSGCHLPEKRPYPPRPDVAPPAAADTGNRATQTPTLSLDPSVVSPMYSELVAIDLPAVVKLATADNLDIQKARQAVRAANGSFESALGSAFPAIVPTALFERRDGKFVNTDGRIFNVGVSTFSPSIAIDWIINPGQVVYNILAARKRLYAAEYLEESVRIESLRQAAVQYYDLILAQSRVDAARQGVRESEELVRIEQLRIKTGTGVRADALRAGARLAARRQNLILAVQGFYRASIGLADTLHLDPGVTLVPSVDELPLRPLVRNDLPVEDLLGIALAHRPDLQGVREQLQAVVAERKRTWWSGFGPQFSVGIEYGGVTGHANNVKQRPGLSTNLLVNPAAPSGAISADPVTNAVAKEALSRVSRLRAPRQDQTFTFSDFSDIKASAGWRLSLATFGQLKEAAASEATAVLEADETLHRVRAEVILAHQAVLAGEQMAELASSRLEAAAEALRLAQVQLQAGTMMTLDVLQAQDALTDARYQYAQTVVGYDQAQVNLLAAIGLLNGDLLGTAESVAEADTPANGQAG